MAAFEPPESVTSRFKGGWSRLGAPVTRRVRLDRWAGPIRLGLAVSAASTAVAFAWRLWVVLSVGEGSVVAADRGIYKVAAMRWVGGGFWYYPEQVAGPYVITQGHVLYPPTALAWLVPAAYLPDLLWWGIPTCVIAGIVWHHRPKIWAWPVIGLCLSTFWSVEIIASGNPGLWIAMFAAVGTVWRPAFALVLLKPSLGPIALLGARSRGWWILAGSFVLVSVALLPMWVDYVHVLLNGRGPDAVPWYSIRDVPLVSVPLIAWAARARQPMSNPEATGPAGRPGEIGGRSQSRAAERERSERPREAGGEAANP